MSNRSIETRDGYKISIQIISQKNSDGPVCVIGSATGVKRDYYKPYATYLSDFCTAAITFDYRGIGDSLYVENGDRIGALKKLVNCSIKREWALDTEAVLNYVSRTFPGKEIVYVANSVGGHLLGFLENYHLISRVLFISVNSAYWKYWKNFKVAQGSTFPLYTKLSKISKGYFDAGPLKLGEDLPANVALQWSYWSRYPEYMRHNADTAERFDRVFLPVEAVGFYDDELSIEDGLEWGANKMLPHCISRLHYLSSKVPVGHLGFFRKEFEDLWTTTRPWIENGKRLDFSKQEKIKSVKVIVNPVVLRLTNKL
jgi:predicted alpha/beta hydrolase